MDENTPAVVVKKSTASKNLFSKKRSPSEVKMPIEVPLSTAPNIFKKNKKPVVEN